MEQIKLMYKWSEFILNETLKTIDITVAIRNINRELSLNGFNIDTNIINNKINIYLTDFNFKHFIDYKQDETVLFDTKLDYLESLFYRFGWFPAEVNILLMSGMSKLIKYDRSIFNKMRNKASIKDIEIILEPKYDKLLEDKPEKLYHLTIKQYLNNILTKGLICKTKSKISTHLDRIYLCRTKEDCIKLIPSMRNIYYSEVLNNSKINKNTDFIVLEIDNTILDLKLYKDPNYTNGFYTISNIAPKFIKPLL